MKWFPPLLDESVEYGRSPLLALWEGSLCRCSALHLPFYSPVEEALAIRSSLWVGPLGLPQGLCVSHAHDSPGLGSTEPVGRNIRLLADGIRFRSLQIFSNLEMVEVGPNPGGGADLDEMEWMKPSVTSPDALYVTFLAVACWNAGRVLTHGRSERRSWLVPVPWQSRSGGSHRAL